MTLLLPSGPHWELEGTPDPVLFLASLTKAFPAATSMFVEAASMASDVEERLTAAAQAGPYLPAAQTLWPPSKRLRVRFEASLLADLSELAQRHAEPELFDHLSLYAGDLPILEYPDAFLSGSVVYVSPSVVEDTLRAWAASLELEPRRHPV